MHSFDQIRFLLKGSLFTLDRSELTIAQCFQLLDTRLKNSTVNLNLLQLRSSFCQIFILR
ncbi:hypothetical protein PL9214640306 [Planktothrix tepida PCC 9214]|uniref:Uncharacterized protein n=1 Tax=Planktothrix tepida PCC 9214 TaxID=671072 RepID=A0A1J1LP71_9CYAN|nr:hypothetical protein PL9214640306 [Planktothrix tepida PCC 9214]